jgi:hypothetical protein
MNFALLPKISPQKFAGFLNKHLLNCLKWKKLSYNLNLMQNNKLMTARGGLTVNRTEARNLCFSWKDMSWFTD